VGWKAIVFRTAENRILRYDPLSSAVWFRKYTNRIKGCLPDGLLYGCQSGSRRVVRFNLAVYIAPRL
jgi:hypothetical protein